MHNYRKERRKYQRFDVAAKVHFYVDYDLITKVKFRVACARRCACDREEWEGITRNISAEGMRFSSDKRLKKGERLHMEVYLPEGGTPIPMEGEVRWSKKISPRPKTGFTLDTGVKLLRVKGKSVVRSIHIDRKYNEPWSIVLDSVFGSFRRFLHKVISKKHTHSPAVMLKETIKWAQRNRS